MMNEIKKDIKLYKISRTFYELREISTTLEKINYIVNKHRESIDNNKELNKTLSYFKIDNLMYHMYVFSQEKQDSIWKDFLPLELTNNERFIVQKVSFALFVENGIDIYVIIGGSGIQVIRRFLNESFGLDILARIAIPEENKVQSTKTRSVTGNVARNSTFFRNNQRLINTISFGEIHKEINFEFREETIVDIFNFLNPDIHKKVFGLASSAFQIKVSVTFEQTHEFVKQIIEIEKIKDFASISSFTQVSDMKRIEDQLRPKLYRDLRDDLIKLFEPHNAKPSNIDFDFCHPSSMADFYESDSYRAYEKGAKKPFLEVKNRQEIYKGVMKYVYENINYPNLWDFMSFLGGVMVKGIKEGRLKKIKAPFIYHISCEIKIDKAPYFCIDTKWYKVRGKFIDNINIACQKLFSVYSLNLPILSERWLNPKVISEDEYNCKYLSKDDYFVFDKIIVDNIELCDILHYSDNKLYLIHVKKGFDAKIRDLSSQINISAQRLWDDVKSASFKFIDELFQKYKKSSNFNNSNIQTQEEFRKLFEMEIIYVLAFVSESVKKYKVTDDVSQVNSNIAKFSLINCIKEMESNSYPIRIVEIERH
jgi:uncharacterized protein (TIGR04141 family)